MNGLTIFGLAAVAAMLLFYALEARSPAFVLAFACACVAASAYGFLQGAWPFGAVEAVWSLIAATPLVVEAPGHRGLRARGPTRPFADARRPVRRDQPVQRR